MVEQKRQRTRGKAKAPRVAVCIGTRHPWGRERLFGFLQYAQGRDWQTFGIQQDNHHAVEGAKLPEFDGAVVFDCLDQGFQAALKARSRVCVEIDSQNLHLADAAVFLDDDEIVRVEVEHLRAAGFRRLAFHGFTNNPTSDTRIGHFSRRTGEAGRMVFRDAFLDGPVDIAPLTRWLKGLPKPAGVVACDDRAGERTLAACRWAGIRVPEEIGVIGIGNDELICELAQPRLSSVMLPTRRIGWLGAETLDRLMSGEALWERWRAVAPLDIVTRGSTDRLPEAGAVTLKACGFMRAESGRAIGVEQVAAAAGVSRRTLERVFRAETGETVHEHLTRLRLREAQRLLRQAGTPLGEVPGRSGYLSQTAFKQMFVARTGLSPREWRERHASGLSRG
jgi:LacI family transcriptional regulator